MVTETAINKELHPYGAWYTSPGGLLFERADYDADAARARLRQLRDKPEAEPRYSHKRVVITYGLIGVIHVPFAFVNLGLKSAVKDVEAGDWAGFGFGIAVVLVFLALAAKNVLRPPQRTPFSMFKGYLAAAIGLSRGRAYSLLLSHDKADRLRVPPPPQVEEGSKGEALPFNDQNKFERYWLNAFGGGWHPWKSISLRDVQSVEIAPDLVLMQADVKVTMRSSAAQFMALIPIFGGFILSMIAFAVVFLIVFTAGNESDSMVYWVILAAVPLALGSLVGIVMLARSLVPIGSTTLPVRKLLIRVNDQWRVFNGELQGAEETDVTWLLAQE